MFDVPNEMDFLSEKREFQVALSRWYAGARRPLPWRTEPSVYRTVVSELMAQQTQIKTMLPYFERWMQRFPDFLTLAAAPTEAVLKHWEGLGYYSRARNLHRLAQVWVATDQKPRTRAEWQSMPGIGPYTSAAIASICFKEAVAVVDGNVVRVLTRLTADQRTFANNAAAVKALTPLANELMATDAPGDHNQAMMELGATVCLKHKPLCAICPVAGFCAGRTDPDLGSLPRIQRKATEHVILNRAWAVEKGAILLYRIPETEGQLAGHYELPPWSLVAAGGPGAEPFAVKTRAITHRRIREHIHACSPGPLPPKSCRWVPLNQLDEITLSGPHRKWISALLRQHAHKPGSPQM